VNRHYCINCGCDLSIIDDDANGRKNCTCARCRAEEEHDFDAEPNAKFNRIGWRVDDASPEQPEREAGE
jgi:hypothetical protein